MSEAEVFEGLFDALDLIVSLVSLFFAIVSGYLAALYFFLGRAPFILRAMAFLLLTISFTFLGGTAKVIETMQNGLYGEWAKLNSPPIPLDTLRNPVDLSAVTGGLPLGLQQQELGVMTGWVIASLVYLALAYLTFFYRWPKPD